MTRGFTNSLWKMRRLWLVAAAAGFGSTGHASPLLHFPEPRHGLLADSRGFAKLGGPGSSAAVPHGYARHMQAVQEHYLAVERRHPPIFYFFCTVYYVPRQSGFTAEGGFNMATDTRLRGRKLPKAFVDAVRMEGTGRLAQPGPQGQDYISYLGDLRKTSLGNRNNTLVDRKSAAVHRRNPLFRHGTPLRVMDPAIYNTFGGTGFETGDTGGGLFPSQIDLYWGEDDPRSPREIYRPASCDIAVRWIVPVIIGAGG